jgi:pantothenate kinase
MTRIDKEITVLVVSFFALCIVAAIFTANSKAVVTAIEASRDQTPMQKLLDNIPSGCSFENKTEVSPSPTNGGIDHIITIRCLE